MVAILSGCIPGISHSDPGELLALQAQIERDFPAVQHRSYETISSTTDTILFDVRESGEYAVSHIPGAIQVDPDMDAETFIARYGDDLTNKQAVFYCSVGVRSSRLASRVGDAIGARGGSTWNLEHGIFGWHNASRTLVYDTNGEPVVTDLVHPYNRRWGRLLKNRDQTAYSPPDP